MSDHHPYIHQVADALRKAGVPVAYVHIDTPEQAADRGREYALIELTTDRPVQSFIWTDRHGWMTSTHADHYAILPGEIRPDPAAVAKEASTHIHTLRYGGYLSPLPLG